MLKINLRVFLWVIFSIPISGAEASTTSFLFLPLRAWDSTGPLDFLIIPKNKADGKIVTSSVLKHERIPTFYASAKSILVGLAHVLLGDEESSSSLQGFDMLQKFSKKLGKQGPLSKIDLSKLEGLFAKDFKNTTEKFVTTQAGTIIHLDDLAENLAFLVDDGLEKLSANASVMALLGMADTVRIQEENGKIKFFEIANPRNNWTRIKPKVPYIYVEEERLVAFTILDEEKAEVRIIDNTNPKKKISRMLKRKFGPSRPRHVRYEFLTKEPYLATHIKFYFNRRSGLLPLEIPIDSEAELLSIDDF